MTFPLLDKDGMHAREAETLAGYAMPSARSRGRRHREPESPYRTAFQRDRDRIIHSTAFRRLEYKTQVFVNHEGDHYRTRLTHTLEVAQISRSIARILRLNEDLVEAIALSHDLGHPPFGHAGESALDLLTRDSGGFDHNLQSLRVVDLLEKRYPEFEGLNLSWEIRESIVKHGVDGDAGQRQRIKGEFDPGSQPLLEAQLTDIADALAYDTHDIDDGLRSGFITIEDLRDVRLWADAERQVAAANPSMVSKTLVARTISRMIDSQITDLILTTRRRLEEEGVDSLEKVRLSSGPLVGFSEEMAALKKELQSFLLGRLYNHYRAVKMTEKARRFVSEIFEEYSRNPLQLPPEYQRRVAEEGAARVICDYIAGMTDRFCQDEYRRLFHPFERV
jgi:dGTPase